MLHPLLERMTASFPTCYVSTHASFPRRCILATYSPKSLYLNGLILLCTWRPKCPSPWSELLAAPEAPLQDGARMRPQIENEENRQANLKEAQPQKRIQPHRDDRGYGDRGDPDGDRAAQLSKDFAIPAHWRGHARSERHWGAGGDERRRRFYSCARPGQHYVQHISDGNLEQIQDSRRAPLSP